MMANMSKKVWSYLMPKNSSEGEITFVKAQHLSPREVMNRLSTINESELRKQLAQQIFPFLKTPAAQNNKQIFDIPVDSKDKICYASCSLACIDGKFDMYLAYYYSVGAVSVAFQTLHQRMQNEWPNELNLSDDKNINVKSTLEVTDVDGENTVGEKDMRLEQSTSDVNL
jgi:hypothetical protein